MLLNLLTRNNAPIATIVLLIRCRTFSGNIPRDHRALFPIWLKCWSRDVIFNLNLNQNLNRIEEVQFFDDLGAR